MGCFCGKPSSAIKDSKDSPKQRELIGKASKLAQNISSRRQERFRVREKLKNGVLRIGSVDKKGESFRVKEKLENEVVRTGSIDKLGNRSRRVRDYHNEKKIEDCEVMNNFPCMGSFPKALEGEQVAAGWPSWLVMVAGEAIRGWIPRKADTFEKLDKIGQGTYSSVYKGRDLLNNKVVALKKVRFDNMDPESVKFMAREILLLRRLDHPNIIKLEGLVTSRTSSSLYLVFEYMEHDLTGLASLPGVKFTESQVKCYMQQLLSGLDYCHSNGVLHRDIKGSNLLIDNHGILKIADFGLASYFDNHQIVPLTSRVVTLWYRPPELLFGATRYGIAVDLWSTGCILGELYAGKPIMPGRTEVEQLHKIFKLCGSPSEDYWRKSKLPYSTVFKHIQPYRRRIAELFKDNSGPAIGLIETLLSIDPASRGTAAAALKSEFFTTKPFACDPSSLPKYPPSKEIDAKLREEEARRQGTPGVRGHRGDNDARRSKEMRAAPAYDANSILARPMQRRQGHPNPKSRSEAFSPHMEEAASGFPIGPPRRTQYSKASSKDISEDPLQKVSHSGPLAPEMGGTFPGKKHDDISIVSARADLSTLSGLVASMALSSVECRNKSESFGDPIRQQDRRRYDLFSSSRQMENGRSSTKEPVKDGHGSRGNKMHFSGPLLLQSNNMDQMLREHDLRIQEAARRLRHDKTRASKVRLH
ncbi:probable serine threonine- kinase At1g54610 [Olea europaea subsp. europaea]|uniref:Probable serine threonine- kinase At1g54610 n=1 Tax=Olea europaea subsp. europaea TaxID=158383 RepID=A0A8S0RQB5_OLEEU|nr:probable serine threonine- kinase At1g54610 [Olea europaea subsp. europaea]